jgi:drug/metabolite transporter (DMT)-like permease
VSEGLGIAAALTSSALGGLSVAITRFVIGMVDPFTLGALRFGIGFAVLLVFIPLTPGSLPRRRDIWAVLGLGSIFFCLSPVLFNSALIYTSAARGALAMAMVPMLTMAIGAALGTESFTRMKFAGVLVAIAGVAIALPAGNSNFLIHAWYGNLLMVAAAICMAIYSALSVPIIRRVGALRFTTAAMGIGALELAALAFFLGNPKIVFQFGHSEWLSIAYLAIVGGALTSLLWVLALNRIAPTLVAISVTIHPITAAAFAAGFLGEPIEANILFGIAAVAIGIFLASKGRKQIIAGKAVFDVRKAHPNV